MYVTNMAPVASNSLAPCDAPSLLRLPCELLLQTSSYLSLVDLFSLRLTCRHVETYLFDSFCKEFFAERRFMITFDSLMMLINISKHKRLSGCLSYLTIGLDRFSSSDALPRFVDYWDPASHTVHGDIPRVKDGINPQKLDALMFEQNCLISSGQFQLMLAEALSNLASLEQLSLRDRNIARRTTREGSNPFFVSYGAAHVLRETGMDFTNNESHLHHQDHQFVDVVFSAVLLALGRGKTRLKSLAVDIQRGDIGLSSSAFSLPPFLLRDIQPTLSNLQSLDLSASFTQVAVGSYSSRSNGFLQWQRHQLFTFLEQTPNLVTLRVKSKKQGFFADGIIGWLASFLNGSSDRPGSDVPDATDYYNYSECDSSFALSVPHREQRFRKLCELELGNMVAPLATLSTTLFCLSASLKRLKLDKVALSVQETDHELDNNPGSPNAWSSLFESIYVSLNLEELSVSALEHHTGSCSKQNGRHPVAFLSSNFGIQASAASGMLSTWSHAGSTFTMKKFLREMSAKTIIICSSCKRKNHGYWTVEESIAA
ncbi:hypothetical protein F4809DRAFT_173242 [Biscogniauxia mediterranea]|nr:hypothetical protein F4809DRAFT_173242 [Biscogniauxia mediterranea]